MAGILRGEIRWADPNPATGREQAGLRPVVILSQDIFNERSGTVMAMAITSQPQRAGFPLTLEHNSNDRPKRSIESHDTALSFTEFAILLQQLAKLAEVLSNPPVNFQESTNA